MRRALALALGTALAAAGACGPGSERAPSVVVERDGEQFVVDGVALPHGRWVPFVGSFPEVVDLSFTMPAGDVDVRGGAGRGYAIEVFLASERPEDGEVVFEAGRVRARSTAGARLLVAGLRGVVPREVGRLVLASELGDVSASGFDVASALEARSGRGGVRVHASRASVVRAESGGEAELVDVDASRLELRAGPAATVRGCRADETDVIVEGETRLEASVLGDARFDFRAGSARLVDCVGGVVRLVGARADVVFEQGVFDTLLPDPPRTGVRLQGEVFVGGRPAR